MPGAHTALSEITLVLFTTLAPAGALSFVCMGIPILLGWVDEQAHRMLDRIICLPLIVSMIGLIASATHLGNPSNALYAFSRTGSSPLSTEVSCAVLFLLLGGLYWLYSFAQHPHRRLQRIWMACIVVASAAFIVSIAFAYSVRTIPIWNSPFVPACLLLNAVLGCSGLTLLGFHLAHYSAHPKYKAFLVIAACCSLVALLALYAMQNASLSQLSNAYGTAAELAPWSSFSICLFGLLSTLGLAMQIRFLKRKNGQDATHATLQLVLANILVFAAIFIMRFLFYALHMTSAL